MHQTQQNYKSAVGFALFLIAAALAGMAQAGTITARPAPDPLLSDGKPGPCDPRLDRPDYLGGVDVAGNPVAPADVPSAQTPVPAEILVPLGGRNRRGHQGAVAELDGKALDPLLNSPPACPSGSR